MAHYAAVNADKGFVAVYSPKCAQTTITDWFIASLGLDRRTKHAGAASKLIAVRKVVDHPELRKIFFVREPLSRVVSFYCGFVVANDDLWCFADDAGRFRLEGATFAEMVATLVDLTDRGEPLQHHLRPQLEGVESVDFDTVVLIERFDEVIGPLSRELGFDYEPRRLNVTDYTREPVADASGLSPAELAQAGIPPAESFYTPDLIDAVSAIYADDVAFYEACSASRSSRSPGG